MLIIAVIDFCVVDDILYIRLRASRTAPTPCKQLPNTKKVDINIMEGVKAAKKNWIKGKCSEIDKSDGMAQRSITSESPHQLKSEEYVSHQRQQ